MTDRRCREGLCLEHLVQNMFQDVFTPEERAGLLVLIEAWEAENPNSSAHMRVTAWIDIAYRFQAERPVSEPGFGWLPALRPVSILA